MTTAAPSATLQAILTLLSSKDYYSAHQKARTTSVRLTTPRSGPPPTTFDPKAREAATLLWETSRRLLEAGQVGSGADLAGLLVDVWEKRGVECGEEDRGKVCQLMALIGGEASWRKTFSDAVFAWSAKTGSGAAGDEAIHGYLGTVLYKEQNYHAAELHLLLCYTQDAARTLADVLWAWSKLDPEGITSCGRYAARGVLSYLEAEAILPARTFLSHFLSHALSAEPTLQVVRFPFPSPSTPLHSLSPALTSSAELLVTKLASLNYLQMVVLTCQAGNGETVEPVKGADGVAKVVKGGGRKAWEQLGKKYEREVGWLKSPEVKESLQVLGTLYFGIAPPRAPGNPLMDMLGGMFGAPPASGGAGRGNAAIRGGR